jgi:hypothetical protein
MTAEELMLRDLARSGLTRKDARRHRFVARGKAYMRNVMRRDDVSGAIEIPYPGTEFSRYRLFKPYKVKDKKSGKKSLARYWQPGKSAVHLYVPRGVELQSNVITCEGEKKAIFSSSLGLPAVAVPGVWCFRRDGELVPELKKLAAQGATILVVFDGNVHTNPQVRKARDDFAMALTVAGAKVLIVDMPRDVNYDDFLLEHGADGFNNLPRREFDLKAQIATIREAKGSGRQKKQIIADMVQGDLVSRGRFLHTTHRERLYFDDGAHRLLNLTEAEDTAFQSYVNDIYGVNASEAEWSFLYKQLTAHAHEHGEGADVHAFSYWNAAKGRLYVAASPTEMFRVSSKSVERLPNGSDGVFMRVPLMEPVPNELPSPDDTAFTALMKMPNFAQGREATPKQFRLLFRAFMFAIFAGPAALPTRPLALFHGEKGGGKSTVGRAVLRTLFGPAADVSLIDPDKPDGLDAAFATQHVVVLDNIDGRHKHIENRLAVAATGGQLTKRVLFKTNEEIRIPVRCFVIANTRQPDSFTRDDVVDRLLYLPTARRDGQFVPERELLQKIDAGRAAVWAYVLDLLPEVVRLMRAQFVGTTQFRMADFANFAARIAPVLGAKRAEVEAALKAVEKEKTAFVAEQSPLPDALEKLVSNPSWAAVAKGSGEKPMAEQYHSALSLLQTLRAHIPDFPIRNPMHLGQKLRNEIESLQARVNIDAKYSKNKKSWSYQLSAKE